jgi:hypothetical protein
LIVITRCHSSSVWVAIDPVQLIPALLTMMFGASELFLQRRDRRQPVGIGRHVEPIVDRLAAMIRVERSAVRIEIGDEHAGALLDEAIDDRAADAARAARDERDPSLQPSHRISAA